MQFGSIFRRIANLFRRGSQEELQDIEMAAVGKMQFEQMFAPIMRCNDHFKFTRLGWICSVLLRMACRLRAVPSPPDCRRLLKTRPTLLQTATECSAQAEV